MRAAAGVGRDELHGRLFALQRALDDAAGAGRAAMIAAERSEGGDVLATIAAAVAEVEARLADCRVLDTRHATFERAFERIIVDHAVGTGESGVDHFTSLFWMGVEDGRTTVHEAARRLFASKRAVARALKVGGYPSPCVILSWGALLALLYRYAVEETPLRVAAQRTGFSDQFTASTMVKHRTGVTPRDWRAEGADFDALVDRMVETWRSP